MRGTEADEPSVPKLATPDPQVLAADAGQLAERMRADETLRLDIAYQLLGGRHRIAELEAQLATESRRLNAALRSLAPAASAPSLQRALVRAVPWFLCFLLGMIAFAALTALLAMVTPCNG